MERIRLEQLPSPCFVVDEVAIERNLKIIDRVQQASGAKVLLALKGFAMWSLAPLVMRYLKGTTASGLHEARLGREAFGGESHVYCAAFGEEFPRVLDWVDHISFNSFTQWRRFRQQVRARSSPPSCGIRINPEHSEVEVRLYDPCAPCSRLGVTLEHFERHLDQLEGIEGLHFHTLCELNADALARTLAVVERNFGRYFEGRRWLNMGGGHHITRPDYDVDGLIELIRGFKNRWPLEVYLEPGEAVALDAGVLVATVQDVIENHLKIAILDTSATTHMPDVLEMPYRPRLIGELAGGLPDEKPHTYRLGGQSCLAGDVIGDYSFDRPLQVGDKLVFADMAHYSMVKTTTFNGVPLPAIAIHNSVTGDTRVVRRFGYEDYKMRLS